MNDLHFDILIAAPAARVWEALTGKEGVAALYFGCRLEGPLTPGSGYAYAGPDGKGGEGVHVEGEVLEAVVGERLVLRHRAGPLWQQGEKVFSSRVAYLLAPGEGGTRVTIHHDQWMEGDPGHAHTADGWGQFLKNLKGWLEHGTAPSLG